jgi:hypothetical protein
VKWEQPEQTEACCAYSTCVSSTKICKHDLLGITTMIISVSNHAVHSCEHAFTGLLLHCTVSSLTSHFRGQPEADRRRHTPRTAPRWSELRTHEAACDQPKDYYQCGPRLGLSKLAMRSEVDSSWTMDRFDFSVLLKFFSGVPPPSMISTCDFSLPTQLSHQFARASLRFVMSVAIHIVIVHNACRRTRSATRTERSRLPVDLVRAI